METPSRAVPAPAGTEGPNGLGGWLILPAIFLFIQPLAGAWEFGKVVMMLIRPQTRTAIIYWPNLVIDLMLVGAAVYLLRAFFQRKASFPSLLLILVASSFALWTFTNFCIPLRWFVPRGYFAMGGQPCVRELLISLVWTCVFTPYILYSRRIINTFTEDPGMSFAWSDRLLGALKRRRLLVSLLTPVALVIYFALMLVAGSILVG